MISARTSDFRRAVNMAAMVVEKRNTLPILSTIRCRANGKLEMSGTDLDMTIDVSVPREGKDEADFTLGDFRFVSKALGASGEQTVKLAMVNKELSIEAGSLSIRAKHSLPADDWPTNCGVVAEETFGATLSPEHIRQISRVVQSISKEETRYYLNGVYLHFTEGWGYRAVTTDGHRLSVVDLALPDATGKLDGLIIPRKAVGVLLRLLSKSDDPVRLSAGYGRLVNHEETTAPARRELAHISFAGKANGADVLLSTKTIDGAFPDYSRVIPKANDIKAMFAIVDLRRAVEAVSHTSNKVNAIKLSFEKGVVRLSSYFAEMSTEAAIEIAAKHNAPKDFSIGFNGQYVLDMLGSLTGEEVVLSLADQASPTLFQDPADTAFTGVLMPMRV